MLSRLRQTLVLVWLLAVSVVATIYLAWVLYPLAMVYFELPTEVGLSEEAVLANFNSLMFYLLSPMVKHLTLPDLAISASGFKHFADVKWLFQLAQGLGIVLAYPSLTVLYRHYRQKTLWRLEKIWLSSLLLPLMIAFLGFLIGFDHFFTLFHYCLFPGDSSWLFNPQTDPVILMLPAPFFLACFVLFFLIYEGILLILWLWSKSQWRLFRQTLWHS